jgi:hypothetical protein
MKSQYFVASDRFKKVSTYVLIIKMFNSSVGSIQVVAIKKRPVIIKKKRQNKLDAKISRRY